MTAGRSGWGFAALLGGVIVIVAIAAGLGLWAVRDGITEVHAALTEARPWLLAWRVGLFAGLMLYWNELVSWATRAVPLHAEAATELRDWRWRAGAWLLLVDLVLVEDAFAFVARVVR